MEGIPAAAGNAAGEAFRMGRENRSDPPTPDLSLSSHEFFDAAVSEACEKRNVKTVPVVKSYLVNLLQFYMTTENLFDEVDESGRRQRDTLAEMYLRASNSEPRTRIELLKKIGDRSLYISGFFGDSLQRKVVDVDYYAGMGGSAYATLADCVRENGTARVYKEFAARFIEFVEVLTHISVGAFAHTEQNILRLYENYARTGSDLARERLLEKGLIAIPITDYGRKRQ